MRRLEEVATVRTRCRALVGVLAMLVLAPSVSAAESVTVSMKDRVFTPQRIEVKVGDTVQWVNDDTELHQVISGSTPYDRDLGHPMNSGTLMWNAKYSFTFTRPGSYRYMCMIHRSLDDGLKATGMVGEVIVTGQNGHNDANR